MSKKKIILFAIIFFVLGIVLTLIFTSINSFSVPKTAMNRTWCVDFNSGESYWSYITSDCSKGGGWLGTKDHSKGHGIQCDWEGDNIIRDTCRRW